MSNISRLFFLSLLASSSAIVIGCSDADNNASVTAEPTQSEAKQPPSPPEPPAIKKAAETGTPESDADSELKNTTQPQTQNAQTNRLPAIPQFKDFAAGPPRKQAFFDFMAPLIKRANAAILEDRERLKGLISSQSIEKNDQAWLKKQAERYGVDNFNPSNQADLNALLTRIDAIPAALALAQGANESAWGTSRFARQANNYFGQWCFSKGCGLVPKRRNDGASHEVRAFDHPYQSIISYIHNLNSHRTYEKLRQIRAQTRQKGQTPTGLEMAEGLVNYSERKHEYVKELQSMIRYNKLTQYN